ncbi:MAG: ABC transporter ATP-binding protein [Gemmatimonadetes bacterium]|nr:ABC transporter ATP-binding protein [Gemmatimonadota bacterium]
MRRALGYVRPYAGRLALVVVLSLVSTALSLAQPFLSKVLVDRALIGRDFGALGWTVAGFLALTGASLVLNVFSGLRYTRVSADILFDMRLDVFRHLQRLSPRWFTRTPIGQIASRVNSDIAEIQRVAAEVALAWIGQVAYLVGSVVMLVLLDVRLFAVGLLALPLALWAMVAYRKRLEGQVAQVRDHSAGVGTFLIEALQGMKLLVAHNAQQRSEDEFRRRNTGFVESLIAMRRLTYLSGGLPGVLLAVGSAAVFLYGGYRVIEGAITMGTLVAFAAYQMRLLSPIQGLMGIYASVASARVSLTRVQEILDTPVEVSDPVAPTAMPTCRGAVALRDVAYTFDRGAVLDGVSFELAAGERVAIIGESGVGKSTIADLLVRHADPLRGVVLLDGVDVRTLTLATLRRYVLTVETDPFVFHATLAANLRVAAPDADEASLLRALSLVGLAPWLATLPDALATVVGERGRAMSTGERQRLALARAVLADPRVLILDEATGALDPATEAAILNAMDGWLAARTVILITHRPAVAALAPRSIVLRAGRVVADAPTAELLGRGAMAGGETAPVSAGA